jgi:hypothetical protein
LKNSLKEYLKNPYIDEIVICDENGNDVKEISREFPNESKLRLYTNENKLKAFYNKRKVVSLAKNDWVALIDSDNFAPVEYFEAWEKYINENGGIDWKTICSPIETFDIPGKYSQFKLHSFFNTPVGKEFKNGYLIKNSDPGKILGNIGNYIVHKDLFLSEITEKIIPYINHQAYDALLLNYILLHHGGILQVIPNILYKNTIIPFIMIVFLYRILIQHLNTFKMKFILFFWIFR